MDRIPSQVARALEAPTAPATAGHVFDLARVRRVELSLAYAGAVTPTEAWLLMQAQRATLVDVRTAPEFKFVGHVPGTLNVEWHGKDEAPLAAFIDGLRRAVAADTHLLLICRSGVRSHAAATAATAAGYERVYNVLEGFEGQIDTQRQRGKVNGWRHAGLPWVQD